MAEPFFHGAFAPGFILLDHFPFRFHGFGVGDEAFRSVFPAVEDRVFHELAHFGSDLVIDLDHPGVHDAHIEAGADGVEEEYGVHGFAHHVVAAEREGYVADAAADFGERHALFDLAAGFDEVYRVVIMFFDTGGDGEDVGIEDNVLRIESYAVHEDIVCALADGDAFLEGIGLAVFIEGHYHNGCAVALADDRLFDEFFFPFLEGDGVNDTFSLEAFQAGFDYAELAGIDHHRDAGYIGLGSEEVEEGGHGFFAVEEGVVHVHVDDLRAAFHLLAGNGERFFV